MFSPILSAGYWQQIGISAFTMHDQAIPPVPPLPTPLLGVPGLIEGPAPMGWPLGFLVHKKEQTVLVDGNPGIKQGHDIGYIIPHFAIPLNAMCAVHTVFSKHKVMMPVSTVLLKGSPAGTYLLFLLGQICCNPVSLPTGVVLLIKCTVWTTLSIWDVIKGIAYIALEVIFDALWNKFFKSKMPKFPGPGDHIMQVLGGLTFIEMITWGGGALVARYILSQIASKLVSHIVKSWFVAPLLREGVRTGSPGLGRGEILRWKFFGPYW